MFYVPVLESKSDLVPVLMIVVVLLSERLSQGKRNNVVFISAGERWEGKCENIKLGIGGGSFSLREEDTLEPGRNVPLYEKVLLTHNQWALGRTFRRFGIEETVALLVIVRYTKYLWSTRRSLTEFLHPNFLCSDLRNIILGKDILTHAAAAKSLQSCPTLCDPIDGSPPGSPVPGILQARTLEWAAISFSNAQKWKVKVNSFSPVRFVATPSTAAYQAPPSMGFSRQEYWSGLPLPSPF